MVCILASVVENLLFLLEWYLAGAHEEARGVVTGPLGRPVSCRGPAKPSLPMLISFLVVNMEEVPKCHLFPPRGVAHVEGWGGLCCRGQVEQMAPPKWEDGSEHISVFIVCQ